MIRRTILPALLLVFLSLVVTSPLAADDFLPIPPEELAMKDNPNEPGTAAILLYREQQTDDVDAWERHHYRIKIFKEEGRKHADVEIPYWAGDHVGDIKARTIRPDGSEVPFNGKIYDKLIVKARGLKVQAKTFSLPDVQPGSIIEYRYRLTWEWSSLRPPRWYVQHELFTRRAKFSLRPYGGYPIAWRWHALPRGTKAPEQKGANITLEVENMGAIPEERYMPPENILKGRVEFFYNRQSQKYDDLDRFWNDEAKQLYRYSEDFIGKRGGIGRAVQTIVTPADDPETKLRKIYTRLQQLRNLTFERDRSEKEEKREKLKDHDNIEHVWERGYGYRTQLNRLFAGLVRAAGLEALPVRVSTRDQHFFQKALPDSEQLNAEIVLVRAAGKEYYLDPGTPFCPFGLLHWSRAGVIGLIPGKDGGKFIETPQHTSDNGRVDRKATLAMDAEGNLRGKLEVIYTGQEALTHRLDATDTDEKGRDKQIEDEIKAWLPASATFKLDPITAWTTTDAPLRVTASLELPGWAAPTGKRMLVPLALFHSNDRHPFEHANRVHPVYFSFPFRQIDDVEVTVPAGLRVETLPAPRTFETQIVGSQHKREFKDGKLRLYRELRIDGVYFKQEYYQALRDFYDKVRAGDEEQAILRVVETAGN